MFANIFFVKYDKHENGVVIASVRTYTTVEPARGIALAANFVAFCNFFYKIYDPRQAVYRNPSPPLDAV